MLKFGDATRSILQTQRRLGAQMERTLKIDDPEVDEGLRRMMRANNVIFCTERGGRYFIDKLCPGTRKDYVTLELPRETLERIRLRVSKYEPLQDYEGLVSIRTRRGRQKRGGLRSPGANADSRLATLLLNGRY
jgi:hypothetical protein